MTQLSESVIEKLSGLRNDFDAVLGRPFEHFYCPILYCDKGVDLCEAHIVNRAFRDASRVTTVQRKDVDEFYGSMFEGDWVVIQERGQHTIPGVLANKALSRKLRPRFFRDGRPVEHYIATKSAIPESHTPLRVGEGEKPMQFVLKIAPDEAFAGARWEVSIERDLRLPALVSILKAAHLTLFHLFGYRYVFSPGGRFLGYETLGKFFLENRGRQKSEVLDRARSFFREHVGIVRPLISGGAFLEGSLSDSVFGLCRPRPNEIWGMLVFVKVAGKLYAVLAPTYTDTETSARYIRFLKTPFPRFEVCFAKFSGSDWSILPGTERMVDWPPPAFDDEVTI